VIKLSRIDQSVPLTEIANQYGCSGYVVESIPLALCAAARVRSLGFQSMLEELISAGGDTDTIASIAGQIAGALRGRSGIPEALMNRLPRFDEIAETVQRFSNVIA
jgi:ADP-ribosylglycohydrolase